MASFAKPSTADQFGFLLRLYFGSETDHLLACVQRAYRDLNRTLHGVSRLPDRNALNMIAPECLRSALRSLADDQRVTSQGGFDIWHRETCQKLQSCYFEQGYPSFHIGQAQKWLNMAFKYVHVFGESYLPGFEALYRFGHIPIDNIILKKLKPYGAPTLSTRWSRIHDYAEYMEFQKWVRQKFYDSTPLAVEFHLWQAEM